MSISYAVEVVEERDLGLLRVRGELDWESRPGFKQALEELDATGRPKLVVDLCGVTRMASVFIGTLADAGIRCSDSGRSLAVMLPARLAAVAGRAGLGKVVTIIPVKQERKNGAAT